jgi:hypothetical protein
VPLGVKLLCTAKQSMMMHLGVFCLGEGEQGAAEHVQDFPKRWTLPAFASHNLCVHLALLYCAALQIDDNRRVTSFAEKPKGAALDAMKVRSFGGRGT